jgi:superfamily II DNA/RNA helicase
MRTVLSSAPGATIAVNLPTGSGKSAVAIAPALLHSRTGSLAVFVLPTTSLALDQERATQAHLLAADPEGAHPPRLAYYGDQLDAERAAIRTGIREGTQRILFTSPESMIKALGPSLYAAARAGRLRYFVIDEAHMVASWGVEFRPEFQALSGFRRDLLRAATSHGFEPFKTLLLSATITAEVLDTLVVLFGEPGPVEYVASVFIRPEPEYWIHASASVDDRTAGVVDAVRHLPRPAIVYVSTREQASVLAGSLRADGNRRIAIVSGDTRSDDRLRVIKRWRGDCDNSALGRPLSEVDVIVGTSAFGLGVDQSDVRAVVHACVPETIDRYYQEVGRGGRDGCASAAVLLEAPGDRAVARRLSGEAVIGVELGLERWEAMLHGGEHLGGNRYRVSLDSRRGNILRGSRENEAWNLRTLSLMMRSGLIRLDAEPPPVLEDDTEGATDGFERYVTSAVVEIVDPGHLDSDVWRRVVEPARQATMRSSTTSHALMLRALDVSLDLAELFARAYAIGSDTILGPRAATTPQPACGGCPHCRAIGRPPYTGEPGIPEAAAHPAASVTGLLHELTSGGTAPLVVFLDPSPIRQRHRWPEFGELLIALIRHGIRLLSADTAVLDLPVVRTAHTASPDGYLFLEPNPPHLFAPKVPTLTVHDPFEDRPTARISYFRPPSAPHPRVVVLPPDARDPERSDLLVSELRHPNMDVDTLMAML